MPNKRDSQVIQNKIVQNTKSQHKKKQTIWLIYHRTSNLQHS